MRRATGTRLLSLVAGATLLFGAAATAQVLPELSDLLPPDESAKDVNAKVAAALGNPPDIRFRKIRRVSPPEAEEALYCGQVLTRSGRGRPFDFQLFTYARNGERDAVRILGSNDLNGFRSGRKTIDWLKRAGCL